MRYEAKSHQWRRRQQMSVLYGQRNCVGRHVRFCEIGTHSVPVGDRHPVRVLAETIRSGNRRASQASPTRILQRIGKTRHEMNVRGAHLLLASSVGLSRKRELISIYG